MCAIRDLRSHPVLAGRFLKPGEQRVLTDKICYTINEATAASGLGRTKLYELINAGELPLIKIGARSLIRRKDLEAMLDRGLVLAAA